MAPRCLYQLPDLAGPLPSQFSKVAFAALPPPPTPFLLVHIIFSLLRAEAARACMSEAFQAVKPDGRILRCPLQLIDRRSEGLIHKERGRALRVEKESRWGQSEISSVNQAWLTVSFSLWLMTGLYWWNPGPQLRFLTLVYVLPAVLSQHGQRFWKRKSGNRHQSVAFH